MNDRKGLCVLAAALVTMAIVVPTDSAVGNVTPLSIPADNPVVQAKATGADVVDAVVNLIYHTCIFPEDYLALRRLASVESKDGTAMGTYNIWGVTPDMFNATTNTSNPVLQATYAEIRNAFGIDWSRVQYKDLQKPLYSALAALLYVTSQETPIPSSSEMQGAYWQSNYPSSRSATNYTRTVEAWKGACSGSEQADVAFVVDSTTSTDNFRRVLDYIRAVVEGFALGENFIRVALYQFEASDVLRSEFRFDSFAYVTSDILEAISTTSQMPGNITLAPDTGVHIQNVLNDAFGSPERPNAARILVLVTDSTPASKTSMQNARDKAQTQGVSIITAGISSGVSLGDLVTIATQPVCTHQMQVETFQHLKDLVELTQFRVCREPMIALGMIRCRVDQCRNIAIPMMPSGITIEASTTCDSGNIFISTRTPIPGLNFRDAQSTVLPTPSEPSYIPIKDNSFFVYAKFLIAGDPHLNCYALVKIMTGLRPTSTNTTTTSIPLLSQLVYPSTNPCLEASRMHDRYPYPYSTSVFIQCDLENTMYLTLCPPDKPYFNSDCRYCVGPNSPLLSGCSTAQVVTSGYCGLSVNPCTATSLHNGHYYFACPTDERRYLQCDQWGKAYVQTCPPNEVWRETALTCEFLPISANPCNGVNRFFPYTPDPNAYIMCDSNQIPFVMHCHPNFVWDQADQTCVPQQWVVIPDVTRLIEIVTPPATTLPAWGGTTGPIPYVTRLIEIVTPPATTLPASGGTLGPNGLVSVNFVYPCTHQKVDDNKLFFQYLPDHTKYIHCDLSGNAFLQSCQPGFYFNPASDTCVDGPLIEIPVGRK